MQDSGFQVLLQGNNFLRILQGLGVTIRISIVSVLLSLLLGTLFGIVMTSKSKIVRFLSRIYLEFIRIMPQLVLLFIVYFGLARNFNINISGELSAIFVYGFVFRDLVETPACDVLIKTEQTICYTAGKGKLK